MKKHEADDLPPSLPSLPTLSPSPSTVCTFKTSPCMPAPRAHVENTCARGAGRHGVFNVSHTTPHTHHTTTHHNNTTTTPHGDRDRDRQSQGEKRRRKRRRQENRREKREQRRVIFTVVVHGRSLLMECFFLLIPFARETFVCWTVCQYDSSLISFSASWPVNRFFFEKILRFFCSMQLRLCSYRFKIFRIIKLSSYSFFFPELILHKYKISVEGYMVRQETNEGTNDLKIRQCIARYVEAYVWCIETESEAKVSYRKTKAR